MYIYRLDDHEFENKYNTVWSHCYYKKLKSAHIESSSSSI